MLIVNFNQLKTLRQKLSQHPSLRPVKITQIFSVLIVAFLVISALVNVKVRLDQGQIWQNNPSITEIAGAMSFSTADAPYFLGHAAVYEAGLEPSVYERKREFPNADHFYNENPQNEALARTPLLSTIISFFSPSKKPADLLTSAHNLLFLSCGLTAVMIVITFGATGYWIEGTVAAVGGGLSSAFLVRSSYGRIDTDQLNLGLMYFMFGMAMLSARAKTGMASLLYSFGAALTARVFMEWYGKPELIWMALGALAWLHIFYRKNWIIGISALLIFYIIAPVSPPNPFASAYFKETFKTGIFLFPNTLTTITEIVQLPSHEILIRIAGSVQMGLVCIIGLGLWYVCHPLMALAYSPLLGFALLNFVIGNRAIFYSAPIIWFGAAFLITSAARFTTHNLWLTWKHKIAVSQNSSFHNADWVSCTLGATLAMLVAWVNLPTNYVPRPSFPKPVLEGLMDLKSIATADHSVMASWWDYGYASMFLNDLPTLHDGGSQTGPSTHFFAYAMLQKSQKDTVGILQFLVRQGTKEILQIKSKSDLFDAFKQPQSGPVPDIYLVLTGQMANWIGSISKLANWDVETGKPLVPENNNGKSDVEYIGLSCDYKDFPARVDCGNVSFDLDKGLMNSTPAIVGWARVRDGFAEDVRRYNEDATFGMQTLETNKRLSSQIMNRQLYDSSFNKLYHLGLIETPGITLVYDNYPHIRIYRIAGTT